MGELAGQTPLGTAEPHSLSSPGVDPLGLLVIAVTS